MLTECFFPLTSSWRGNRIALVNPGLGADCPCQSWAGRRIASPIPVPTAELPRCATSSLGLKLFFLEHRRDGVGPAVELPGPGTSLTLTTKGPRVEQSRNSDLGAAQARQAGSFYAGQVACYMCYMVLQGKPLNIHSPRVLAICAICAIWCRSLYTIP